MSTIQDSRKPIFSDLSAENPVTEIESVCMSCYKNGMTRLILTRIPFYRDIIISSFACDHCNARNNEVQSANRIAEKGIIMDLLINSPSDLNREIIKSDYANLKIPEIDFEIPENTQKAYMTTIEGILDRIIENLQSDVEYKVHEEEMTSKLKDFIEKVRDLKSLKTPFHIKIDDPSGDSYIQNPMAPNKDPNMQILHYKRTNEQNEMIGLNVTETPSEIQLSERELDIKNDILQFIDNCPNCNAPCETNMKAMDIPYFKEIIVMATNCDKCGHRSNEIKSGTGISEKALKYVLKLTDISDLNRDILKSETATIEIPELDFFMNSGTLGGKFTTIEGLLKNVIEQLGGSNPFFVGDSSASDYVVKMKGFLSSLEDILSGKLLNVTLVLDDPSGSSYIQNVYAPEDDPNMQVIQYERTWDQNEQLGINDMKTENYQTD